MKQLSKYPHTLPYSRASLLIIGLSIIAVIALLVYGPIVQNPAYHDFADHRTLFGVPNFWNVVSNLPFILVGMIGLNRCRMVADYPGGEGTRASYLLFFAGILLTGLFSAYYHFHPDNWGLFWDRLAMSLSFMALLSIIIGTFVNPDSGRKLLLPLVLFGLFSVVYWIVTEHYGIGDLRLYAITQFLPIFVIAAIICSWKSVSIRTMDILIIGAGYGLAKVFESLDCIIYQTTPVSGHSLKHLAAAFSAYWVVIILGRWRHRHSPTKKNNRQRGENHAN
jgi:ceramidase